MWKRSLAQSLGISSHAARELRVRTADDDDDGKPARSRAQTRCAVHGDSPCCVDLRCLMKGEKTLPTIAWFL